MNFQIFTRPVIHNSQISGSISKKETCVTGITGTCGITTGRLASLYDQWFTGISHIMAYSVHSIWLEV